MQVILQGSLRHFGVAELLMFLCRRTEGEARGTLDLEAGGARARLLFDHDKIVWAESAAHAAPLDVLVDAISWTTGSFTLLDAFVIPENVTPVALSLDDVFIEIKRRAEAAAGYPEATVFRVVDEQAVQQQISLTPDEFRILFRIGTGKTFGEVVTDLAQPRAEVGAKLRRLVEIGLLRVVHAAPTPSGDATVVGSPAKKTTASRKRTMVGSLTPDGAPDRVFPLLDAEHLIGRAPENSITIADGSVSSRHARIVRSPQGFTIEDLKSRNGTYVNGERVTESRKLADGDLIRIGKVILIFNVARETKTGETTQPEVRLA